MIITKFGPVEVKLHRCELGWLPVVVGRHSVPYVPWIDPCAAPCERSALEQMTAAIDRLEAY